MTPPSKKSDGPTWEDVHNELKVLATKDELNQLGDRLGGQLAQLDLRFDVFTQQVGESTRQTASLTAQLAADCRGLKGRTEDHSTRLETLRVDLTTLEVDSARGDKRVGIIASILTFLGALAAAIYGASR
jgi:hypothetical protein